MILSLLDHYSFKPPQSFLSVDKALLIMMVILFVLFFLLVLEKIEEEKSSDRKRRICHTIPSCVSSMTVNAGVSKCC